MNHDATDPAYLLRAMELAADRLENPALRQAVRDALEPTRAEARHLDADRRRDRRGVPPLPYFPSNRTAALVQAAADSYQDAPRLDREREQDDFLDKVLDHLRFLGKPRVEFTWPASPTDPHFQSALAPTATVALLSDWGTGRTNAKRTLVRALSHPPDHIVHLGDIYPVGSPGRIRERFLNIVHDYGRGISPSRFRVLNGNHEMHACGEGLKETLLPWCGQTGTVFTMENAHWRLVAIDTAYEDHGLHNAQWAWLNHQLRSDPQKRKIVLSHHQPFSALDPRPLTKGGRLRQAMAPFIADGLIYAWFFGHEHRWLVYEHTDPRWPFRARGLGHGGKFHPVPFHVQNADEAAHPDAPPARLRDDAPPLRMGAYATVDNTTVRGYNGYVLLSFDGPALTVKHFGQGRFLTPEQAGEDETPDDDIPGDSSPELWYTERWPEA